MTLIFLSLFFIQGSVILVDEFACHQKRYLPTWERWGHPLDTFVMLIPLLLLFRYPQIPALYYFVASALSCLFITKDEWVHSKYCSGIEHWLHSVLFIVHPMILLTAWWAYSENPLIIQMLMILPVIFMAYQIFYWNFYVERAISKGSANSQ